jgi:hypothetical protein
MPEINREFYGLALEATAGTAVTPPTHIIPLVGAPTPMRSRFRPVENRGTVHEFYRSKVTRRWTEFEGEMGLDLALLPLILNQIVRGGVTAPSTPAGATDARLWEFVDLGAGANLPKTATWYWGDPAFKLYQAKHGILDELAITADGTSEDGTMMNLSGHAGRLIPLGANPALPALTIGGLVVPMDWQVWIDEISGAGAIGTTAITGTVLSVEHTLTRNRSYKFIPDGPEGDHTYSRAGYGKYHLETKLTMEIPDMVQFDNYDDDEAIMAVRVRHNGPYIEDVAAVPTYQYAEVDTYGPYDDFAWGEYEGTNRTLEVTMQSEVNALIGSGYRIAVQNTRDTL